MILGTLVPGFDCIHLGTVLYVNTNTCVPGTMEKIHVHFTAKYIADKPGM